MTRADVERRTSGVATSAIRAPEPGVQPRAIIALICGSLGLSVDTLLGPRRDPHIVGARKCACAVLRGKGLTLSGIGRRLGIDHSSVSWHVSTFDRFCDDWPELRILADVLLPARPAKAAAAALAIRQPEISALIDARRAAKLARIEAQRLAEKRARLLRRIALAPLNNARDAADAALKLEMLSCA